MLDLKGIDKKKIIKIEQKTKFVYDKGGSLQSLHNGEIVDAEKSVKTLVLDIKNPKGYSVYLIPRIYWDYNKFSSKTNIKQLEEYRNYSGYTPMKIDVEEYVYILYLKNKEHTKIYTIQPKLKNKVFLFNIDPKKE